MSDRIIILESIPNGVSYVAHKYDKTGRDVYYYRHLDWEEPWCNVAHEGDEFFLIGREGVDEPGIVMHGYFASEVTVTPVSWAERGVFRVFLKEVQVIAPKRYRLLTTRALEAAMPPLEWNPGISGWVVPGQNIFKLRRMWREYLAMNDGFR